MKIERKYLCLGLIVICAIFSIDKVLALDHPYQTGFEATESPAFTPGDLHNQDGWQVVEGTGLIQTNTVYGDSQAVEVFSDSQVQKFFIGINDGIEWTECVVKPAGGDSNLPDPSNYAAGSLIGFNRVHGIMCFDGNGDGTGSWVSTGVTSDSNTWYRIKICQDYTTQTWDCYVNDVRYLQNLGFKDNSITSFNQFSLYSSGDGGTTYLDDFGNPPIFDTDADGLPDDWEQQIVDADPNDDINSIEDVNPGDDFDSDDLTNYEELVYETNPNNPDTDSDGQKDGPEITAGTDPTDASSVFKTVEIKKNSANPQHLDVTWSTVAGKGYKVYWSDGPYGDAMVWNPVLDPDTFTGDGSPMTWTDNGTQTGTPPGNDAVKERYYKVKLE